MEVQELIDIILEEADIVIKESYEEGYKQATLELKPDVEYWKFKYESLEKNNLKQSITIGSISFGIGLLIGTVSGLCISIKL